MNVKEILVASISVAIGVTAGMLIYDMAKKKLG